jgi:hypothetical protein
MRTVREILDTAPSRLVVELHGPAQVTYGSVQDAGALELFVDTPLEVMLEQGPDRGKDLRIEFVPDASIDDPSPLSMFHEVRISNKQGDVWRMGARSLFAAVAAMMDAADVPLKISDEHDDSDTTRESAQARPADGEAAS